MTDKFNERVNVLTELLNEGHITNEEYLDLIDSLRGGSINEDSAYQKEIDNPNKLEEYEDFISGKAFADDELFDPNFTDVSLDKRLGDYERAIHGDYPLREAYNLNNPLHNTFYHIIHQSDVDEATKHFRKQAEQYKPAMGLYRQDVHSGNTIRGCKIVVDTGGKLKCIEPFHSHEHNHSWSVS